MLLRNFSKAPQNLDEAGTEDKNRKHHALVRDDY